MPKLDNYAIGKGGVNNTKSDLHLDDTELVSAQNAEFDLDLRDGGLRKRGGLAVLNASALNSGASVSGLANVPLLTTYTKTLYAALQDAAANTWLTSTDGASWAAGSTITRAQSSRLGTATPTVTVDYLNNRIQPFRQGLVFPGDDYVGYNNTDFTAPTLRFSTPDGDFLIGRVQAGPGATATSFPYMITDLVVMDGVLYLGTYEAGGSAPSLKGRVLQLNLTTGILKQIGNAFGDGTTEVSGGMPWTLCQYRGQLYAGLYGVSGASTGKVVRINPNADATWTTDVANLSGYPMSMASYKGDLYVGCQDDAGGAAAILYKRSAAAGTYAASDNGSGGSAVTHFSSLIVYGTNLYAAYLNTNATPVNKIRAFDGTTWTDSLDLSSLVLSGTPALGSLYPGQSVLFGSALYVAYRSVSRTSVDGCVLKFDGTTWTIATDGKNTRGFLAVNTVRS